MATAEVGPNMLLADIQVLGLAANQTGFFSQSGATKTSGNNSIGMTPNSVDSTQPVTNTYWHGTYLEYQPGVLNQGQTYPDLQFWFHIDSADFSSYMYLDLTVSRSMLTPREKTTGRHYIKLGNSMILAAIASNFPGTNGPFYFTGPKVSSNIDFWFASTAGFTTGVGGTFASPPTFKLWGDVMNQTLWTWLLGKMGAWKGGIYLNSVRRQITGMDPFVVNHQVADDFASIKSAWPTLPDGPGQVGKSKVYRMMKYATPLNAVSAVTPYVLSNLVTGIGGKSGQVGPYNELAWAFSTNPNKAVQVELYGHQPVAGSGYIGLTKGNKNIYPNDTPFGVVDTVGDPRAWYGDNSLYTGLTGQSDKIPQNYDWVPGGGSMEVIAGEDAGYFVAAQNGQTIAANTDYTTVIGYQVD